MFPCWTRSGRRLREPPYGHDAVRQGLPHRHKWYGDAVDEAFDHAAYAWQTGYFEGPRVFSETDSCNVEVAPSFDPPPPKEQDAVSSAPTGMAPEQQGGCRPRPVGIRVDLSVIGGRASLKKFLRIVLRREINCIPPNEDGTAYIPMRWPQTICRPDSRTPCRFCPIQIC